jgi:hypothetical protein
LYVAVMTDNTGNRTPPRYISHKDYLFTAKLPLFWDSSDDGMKLKVISDKFDVVGTSAN